MGWRVDVMNFAGERGRGRRVGRLLVMEWSGSGVGVVSFVAVAEAPED